MKDSTSQSHSNTRVFGGVAGAGPNDAGASPENICHRCGQRLWFSERNGYKKHFCSEAIKGGSS